MAAAQAGVTLVFTLAVGTPTQLSVGLATRRGMMITNNDLANSVSFGFGLNPGGGGTSTVTAAMHIIPPGGVAIFGDVASQSGSGGQVGGTTIVSDVSAVAVTGTPQIAFTEW